MVTQPDSANTRAGTGDVVEHARKVATCIYIAADKIVADDVSATILSLIDEIERLRSPAPVDREAMEAAKRLERHMMMVRPPWSVVEADIDTVARALLRGR